jgi:hypothetical protein
MCFSFGNHWACAQVHAQDPVEHGWVIMGYTVVRVFVVKLSEFLNKWRAGELRAVTAELNEVAERWNVIFNF